MRVSLIFAEAHKVIYRTKNDTDLVIYWYLGSYVGELKCKFESMITFKEKPFEHGQPCSNCPQPSQCVMNQCKPTGKYPYCYKHRQDLKIDSLTGGAE